MKSTIHAPKTTTSLSSHACELFSTQFSSLVGVALCNDTKFVFFFFTYICCYHHWWGVDGYKKKICAKKIWEKLFVHSLHSMPFYVLEFVIWLSNQRRRLILLSNRPYVRVQRVHWIVYFVYFVFFFNFFRFFCAIAVTALSYISRARQIQWWE